MASNVRNQSEKIKFAEVSLAPLSNIRCGGRAANLARPRSLEQLVASVKIANDEGLGLTILGGLTNSLISDRGIEGLTIHTIDLNRVRVQGNLLIAQCGVLMDTLIDYGIDRLLGGMERLGGLPGTVGGAIYGNSGANGLLCADLLYWVDCIDRQGNLIRLRAHPQEYSYRHSPFWGKDELVIYEAAFKLDPIIQTNEARRLKEQYKGERKAKGQYTYPSIGCIFRNPDGKSAGQIIDALGLKGAREGGAAISPHHANFIINVDGTATATDVAALIKRIKDEVSQKCSITLTEEIRLLGQW